MVVKLSGGDSYTHGAVAQLGEHLTCTEGVQVSRSKCRGDRRDR